jgi:hypothetical protein
MRAMKLDKKSLGFGRMSFSRGNSLLQSNHLPTSICGIKSALKIADLYRSEFVDLVLSAVLQLLNTMQLPGS